jgi:glycosyltransferase involved in cell wall biosynthesis
LTPVVSIIVPSFNKEKYISETLKSVVDQTYLNWELLIIDDLSDDNTVEIVKSFAEKDNRIKLIENNSNRGANYCRNQGISNSLGNYIIFLDADDILMPTCLAGRVATIENSQFDFCVFTLGTFYKNIGDSKSIWYSNSKNPLIDFIQHKLPWQTMQPIWQKEFLVKIGGFDELFQRLQDVEIHTRSLLIEGVKFKQISNDLDCYYRIEEERKNFSSFSFLKRWVKSAVMYCDKFEVLVLQENRRFIFGTILKTYSQILINLNSKKITQQESNELKEELFSSAICTEMNSMRKLLFKGFYFYNTRLPHVPGVNWLFSKFIVF